MTINQRARVLSERLALTTWSGIGISLGDGDTVGRDGNLLLITLLLAGDHLLDRLHDVAPLEDTVVLEGLRGELLTLGVLGLEVDLDAVDHRGRTG